MKYHWLLLIVFPLVGKTQSNKIQALDKLIGTWSVEEVFQEGTAQRKVVKGERTCSYALKGTYINCITIEQSGASEREYQFWIHYNQSTAQFEMMSLYSNWSQQRRDVIKPDSIGQWQLMGEPMVEKGVERVIKGVMEFQGDQIKWSGFLHTSKMKEGEWQPIYTEIATRKK